MKEEEKKSRKKPIVIILLLIIVVLVVVFVIPNKEGKIKILAKSSLDRLVEKSELETVNFNYNVIAKKCKKEDKCDLTSNNIKDFEYVVSCTGTLTGGIDFSKVEITVDSKNKKLIVKLPEAKITDVNIGSLKFLNGEDVSASELPNARLLCENTIKEKSAQDEKVVPAIKEQASVVLQSFYEQWIKAIDKSYKVEVW